MADNEIQRAVEEVEVAERHSDELEIARRVYGLYQALAHTDDKPTSRVREICELLDSPNHRVRRQLALATAPQRIRELFVRGLLGGRVVEMLQLLPESKQVNVATRMAQGEQSTLDTTLELEADRNIAGGVRAWTEPAKEFEAALQRATALVDRYLDISPKRLRAILEGAGGTLGRRHLISLVDEQISLLQTLKRFMEPGEKQGGLNGSCSDVVANSS